MASIPTKVPFLNYSTSFIYVVFYCVSVLWVWNILDMITGNRKPGTGSDGYFRVSNGIWFTCQLIYNYMGSNMSMEEGEIMDVPSEVLVVK